MVAAAITPPVQAIGYVRRSTNRQEESLEQQRDKLTGFAQARGWELVAVYADDAISGSQLQRPGLESLIQHAERSADVGVVLAWERNRLARPKDPVDGLLLERRLMQAGKRVFYVATGQEADRSFTSGLVGFVEHYQNGDYLRKLSRDTMRGLVARAAKGFLPCAMAPFGYDRLCLGTDGTPRRIVRNLPDRSQVLLHPESHEVLERIQDGHRYHKPDHEMATLVPSEPARVEAVRRLFADYLAGVPFRLLRDRLNATGLRTATGGVFTISTLHVMLRNAVYKGTLRYNRRTQSKWHRYVGGGGAGEGVEGGMARGCSVERHDERREHRPPEDWIVVDHAWPALVEPALFDQVQAKLDQDRKAHMFTTGQAVRVNDGRGYLLSGTLTCGVCGGRMMGQTHRNKKPDGQYYIRRHYVCRNHHKGAHDLCPTRFAVPAEKLETRVVALIKRDLRHLRGDTQLQAYIAEELRRHCGRQIDARQSFQTRRAELDAQIAKLTAHLAVLDVATATTLGLYAKAQALADERRQVQAQLDAAPDVIPNMPSAEEVARRAEAELAHLDQLFASGSLEERKELVRIYLKGGKVDPATRKIELYFMPALFTSIGTGGCVWRSGHGS